MGRTIQIYEPFTSQTLTSSYVAGDGYNCAAYDSAVLSYSYTTGAGETGTGVQFIVEYANPLSGEPIAADWTRAQNVATSGATDTLTDEEFTRTGGAAATTYTGSVVVPLGSRFVRVSVKESGVSSNAGTLNYLRIALTTPNIPVS